MLWLQNIFRRRRKVRLSIDSLPLLRECGHSDGALGNAPGHDWFLCQYGRDWQADFLRKNRYVSIECLLWWFDKNKIDPWAK